MRKLAKEIKVEAIKLYKTGLTMNCVASVLGVGKKTVQRWVYSEGLSRRKNRIPDFMRDRAIQLYKEGEKVKDIAKQLGFAPRSFYEWTAGTGIVVRDIKGKRNCMWKGGVTDKNTKERCSRQMLEWRISVFERDHFTCVSCEGVGGSLEGHHILSFAKYPEKRFDIDNGITLCIKCHWALHGRKKRKRKIG